MFWSARESGTTGTSKQQNLETLPDVEEIRSQRIRTLREDNEGTLWAGTEDGLLMRYRGGTFATYDISAGLSRTEMMRIDEDTEHNLWMTWAGGVVTRFDRTRAVNDRPGDLDHGVAPHKHESGFAVWWSHDSAGLHCLVNGQVRTLIVGRISQTTGITTVLTDGADNILIRSREGDIIRATKSRTTCTANFASGTSITLFASPTSGRFASWTGGPCAGSTNPSCTFTLGANTTATASFANQPLTFIESTLPDGNVGADYSAFINTTGGSGTEQHRFSLVAGSLPDGLQMQSFFGVQSTLIHGRPTRIQTSTFTVRVDDGAETATRTFTITINAAVTLAITLPLTSRTARLVAISRSPVPT